MFSDSYLPEFDHEMATTRRVLARVPEAKADWRPHPKSTPLGTLAQHITNLVGFGEQIVQARERDVNPPGGPRYTAVPFTTTAAMLGAFDANVQSARAAIAGATDEELLRSWTLKNGDAVFFSMPRTAVLRSYLMSHLIHHRGQLSLYLRLLDVPLPSIYGPTADEAR